MTNFKTTRKNYIISQRLKERQALGLPSLPEGRFNDYQLDRKLGLEWLTATWDGEKYVVNNKTFPFKAENERIWDFQLDFARKKLNPVPEDQIPYDIDIEIDGKKFHKKKTNENWKDEIKNAAGVRVIHIPEVITIKRWWYYLDEKLPEAIASKEMTIYIPG